MPRPPQLEGDPGAKVLLQVRVPLAWKQRLVELAKPRGQDLTEYVRELIRRELEANPVQPSKPTKR